MHTHPPSWPICFGLETELVITVMEDPHRDARGFRVQELLQDTNEANYYSQDA